MPEESEQHARLEELMGEDGEPVPPPEFPDLVFTPPLTALKLSGLLRQVEVWAKLEAYTHTSWAISLISVDRRELLIDGWDSSNLKGFSIGKFERVRGAHSVLMISIRSLRGETSRGMANALISARKEADQASGFKGHVDGHVRLLLTLRRADEEDAVRASVAIYSERL